MSNHEYMYTTEFYLMTELHTQIIRLFTFDMSRCDSYNLMLFSEEDRSLKSKIFNQFLKLDPWSNVA